MNIFELTELASGTISSFQLFYMEGAFDSVRDCALYILPRVYITYPQGPPMMSLTLLSYYRL